MKTYLIKSKYGLGYAVCISRFKEVDICILPYSKINVANKIKNAYIEIGYKDGGILVESEMGEL